jgi:hypothetical protein
MNFACVFALAAVLSAPAFAAPILVSEPTEGVGEIMILLLAGQPFPHGMFDSGLVIGDLILTESAGQKSDIVRFDLGSGLRDSLRGLVPDAQRRALIANRFYAVLFSDPGKNFPVPLLFLQKTIAEAGLPVPYAPGPNDPGARTTLMRGEAQFTYQINSDTDVPEPASLSLFAAAISGGALYLFAVRRRSR